VLVAAGGQDTLIGGAGPNLLQGDTGTNLLQGGSGPNTLLGTGSDTLLGGSGTNQFTLRPNNSPTPGTMNLSAGSGANTIDLSQETSGITLNLNTTGTPQTIDASGNQALLTGQYQTVIGGPNANQITASSNSTVFGGGGNDTLMTAGGSNILLSAPSGNVMLEAQGGSNVTLSGGKNADTLTAIGTNNASLIGGSGSNDSLSSMNGSNETMFGGSGSNDTLSAGGGGHNVTMLGGSGSNDSLSAANISNVTLIGGSLGNDSLTALGGSFASLFGSSGSNDSLSATNVGNVTMFGGSGSNDTLSASGSSNITMMGGSGSNDSLSGPGASNASLFGGSGSNDSLLALNGSNLTLLGGSGSNDSVSASGSSNVTMIGGSGSNDTLSSSGSHNATLFGGSGSNDSLSSSGSHNVTILGGSGSNDSLGSSGEVNITLVGGSGSNDSLSALNGSNVTLLGGSGGNDTLSASSNQNSTLPGGNQNASLFGGSGSNDSLSAHGISNVTLIGGSGSNDTLAATGSQNATMFGGSGSNDSLGSSSGSNVTMMGGSGSNDSLSTSGDSNISMIGGSGSNDSLGSHNSSNVTLIGGSGSNDTLSSSGSHNATLFGSSGSNDSLVSTGSSNLTLLGGSGSNDTLASNADSNITVVGGSGSNDSLSANSSSNATLFGGSGSNDTLSASGGSHNVTMLGGSGSNDSLGSHGSSNITMIGGSGGNDSLSTANDANMSLVGGSGSNDSLGSHGSTNVTLIGGSGSNDTLSSSGSHNATLFGGSGGNDSLSSSNDTNGILYGGSGSNDTLASMGGHNVTMIGGSGSNDSLSSSHDTNATLIGGSMGNHSLTAANDTNVYLLGDLGNNDQLSVSNSSNVTMVGGSGNFDSLSASNSQNVYLFGGSGNNDTLTSMNDVNVTLYGGSGSNDSLTSISDTNATLVGGTGSNDTLNSPTGSNVTLFGGSGNFDSLTSTGDTNATVVGGSGGRQTLTVNNGQNITLINGGRFADTFIINGGANDSAFGGSGDDTLVANGGSNIGLYGENGNKTYQLNGSLANPLTVTLDDLATAGLSQSFIDKTSFGTNTITFPNSVGLTIDLSRTSMGVANPANQQTVASGITLNLVGQFQNVIGTPGNNYIKGNSVDNVLFGGGGNDTLVAGSGNATLVAGTGNDSLVGGSGNDNYLFKGANLGNDTITSASNTNNDTIDLSQLAGGPTSLNLASTAAQTVNSNLTLTLTNPNVANVIGSPAGNTITGDSRDNQFTLSTGNNTITTGTGFNTFFFTGSQLGSDTINNPLGGTDALNFHQFGGPITVDLNQATQAIGSGTVSVNPMNVVDVVGTPFSDVLKGDTAAGAPSVSLIGGGGLDSLVAGSGNDYLQAGITQVVLLDFDTFTTGPGDHIYTQPERDAIQKELAGIYADFSSSSPYGQTGVYFTQSFSDAQAKSRPTGGQYFTLYFNRAPEGGLANEVNWRHVDLGSFASIDVNPILGAPNEPPAMGAIGQDNWVRLSAGLAAHELGHLFGLRHADSFGPIGSGIFLAYDNSNGQQVAGPDPTKFHPTFVEPATSTPVQETNFLSDTGLVASATVFAPETPLHPMATPDAIGTTFFDTLGNLFFSEREAIKLAFDDSGTTLLETTGYHQSFATAQALGTLPSLVVPNTLLQGVNYGKTFQVGAVDVIGSIGIDNNPQDANFGKSQDDYYSFVGHQGDLMNFAVYSYSLPHNPHPIDTVLKIYDAGGNLVAFNDDEFETRDCQIIDFTLPADGVYYAVVDTFTDGTSDALTGNYELFMYSFAATNSGSPQGGGSTLVGGNGQDLLVGSTGNDLFTFLNGATGSATIMGGNGADLVDETPAPHESVTIAPPTPPNTITVKQGVDTTAPQFSPLSNQTIAEGSLLHFQTHATDDPGDVLTYSIQPVAGSPNPFPTGAVINPVTGDFNWDATDEGTYAVELVATDTSHNSSTLDLTITVTDAQPHLLPIANQAVNEGTSVSLQGGTNNPAPSDTYSYGWTITIGGQTVTTGTGQSISFTPGDEGTYTAIFKVTDVDDGTFSTTAATITVNDVAPTVSPLAAQTVNEGTPVSFAGSFSDPGTVDSPAFDWNVVASNGQVILDGTSQNFSFTPTDDGTYTVTFKVQDSDGGPATSVTTAVTVLPVAPTATLSNNGPVNESSPATVSFSNQFDPSSVDTNAGFHYSFANSAAGLATNYTSASAVATANFTFAEEGTYTVYARIFDVDSLYTDYSTTVTVNDPPVSGTGGFSFNATEGSAAGAQTVATFKDPGGPEVSPTLDYQAVINWGDNKTSTGVITLNSATGVFTVQGGHLYAEDGGYNIAVTINHDNAPSVTAGSTATVADPSVLASGGLSVSATEGIMTSALTLATFTDPGGPEVLKDYTAGIAWGDGQNSSGTISLSNGVFTVSGSHQYLEQGSSYSITVTLGHDNSTSVTVTDTTSVAEAGLSAVGQNFAVAEGAATGMITVATFTDLGGPEAVADYSATVAWGDNSTSSGASVVIKPAGDGKTFLVQANHTYVEQGTDTVTVTLGHESAPAVTAAATATVFDPAVVGTGLTLYVNQGIPFTNQPVATFVDPGGPEVLTDYTASINWGDNTPSTNGAITVNNGTFTVSGSHVYNQLLGPIPITITLTHENAPSDVVPSTVVVAPSIFVMNSTQSGALTVSGSSFIHSTGNVVVDSNSNSALMISGTSQIIANQILVTGGVSITGTPTLTPAPTTHVAALPDPLAGLPAPSATGLTNRGSAIYSTGTHPLLPGIYTQISATNSASLVLSSGTYVIKGEGLTVSGAGSITGSGVFIYNSGSNYPNLGGTFGGITISNSGTVSLTAATSGTYANILIFQSRDNPRAISFSGSVVVGMSGEIYAPNALLSLTNSAALKLPVAVNRLTVSGAGTSGLTANGSNPAIDSSVGELVAGDLVVYVNDPAHYFTTDELARIHDTINNLSALLAPYHVTVTEVGPNDRALANVVIDDGTTTPLGGEAQGILGTYTPATGEITVAQGWNWYAGANPAAIGSDQYDFETLVTHELGHALGLGHSPNPNSVMYESLAPGAARRLLTSQDLNIGDPEMIPGALTAANQMPEVSDQKSEVREHTADPLASDVRLLTIQQDPARNTQNSQTSEVSKTSEVFSRQSVNRWFAEVWIWSPTREWTAGSQSAPANWSLKPASLWDSWAEQMMDVRDQLTKPVASVAQLMTFEPVLTDEFLGGLAKNSRLPHVQERNWSNERRHKSEDESQRSTVGVQRSEASDLWEQRGFFENFSFDDGSFPLVAAVLAGILGWNASSSEPN
jgi:Ca2+-binding RTX toxin-like protein